MHLARRLKYLPTITSTKRLLVTNSNSNNSLAHNVAKTESDNEEIIIPDRIQRTPTDILYALSSTVLRDPTAPHFKYHDDPYLIPTSNIAKRTYAMAQEAGKKAAKWIKEEHHTLFMHKEAQPLIKDFIPKMIYTEETEVDETSLRQLIMQSELTDAVFVYNLMKDKGLEISAELKQSLLELICFYNNEAPLSTNWVEERWFNDNNRLRERYRKTWKDGDLADRLFSEIEPKTANSYAAIIRGMCKYYQVERAYALFQEAIEKQIELDVTTFNAIIDVSNFLKESPDQRWDLCCEILRQMAQQQLRPNVDTLNAMLQTASSFSNFKFARSAASKILAEFRKLDIQPSLASYYYLLAIYCRERVPTSHILVDILNEIENKEFSILHQKDVFFFTTAMDVCRNHLQDKNLAKRVDKLLHTGKNYNLIGDSYKETAYYRHFFGLLCETETIEEFMKTYDLLVPSIYTPEPGIMEEILKAVELHGAKELMPRLWSDIIIFEHTNRESLLLGTLRIMINNLPNVEDLSQRNLPEQFAKVAYDIYTKINENEGRKNKVRFTGQMIGDILVLLLRANDFDKAVEVFTHIDKNQHRIPGTPSEVHLLEFIDSCIANKAPSAAIACLEYAAENNMDCLAMAQKIDNGFTLNEVHLSKLKSIVGDNFQKQEI